MNFESALAWLDSRLNREEVIAGHTAGLSTEPVRAVLDVLGNPQLAYPAVHVTGTNGKGTVVACATSLLEVSGLTVGGYTSPHLVSVTERIARSGEQISREDFSQVLSQVADAEVLAGVTLSWFEAVTCVALTWFADVAVDVAVVEVGLLGRYDATNVLRTEVAVLTNVGRDHTDGQPDWRRRVAEEKLGIAVEGRTLILGEGDDLIDELVVATGASPVLRVGEDYLVERNATAVGGRVLDIRTPDQLLEDLFVPLQGEKQGQNVAIALAAVEAFFGRPIQSDLVASALVEVSAPARLEVMARSPLVIVDGAHNPPALEATARTFFDDFLIEGNRTLVVGLLSDKEVDLCIASLDVAVWDRVICTAPSSPRALDARLLADVVAGDGGVAEVEPDPLRAIDRALADADEGDAILVTGSFYLAAQIRSHLIGVI